jgi:hypothetical protein
MVRSRGDQSGYRLGRVALLGRSPAAAARPASVASRFRRASRSAARANRRAPGWHVSARSRSGTRKIRRLCSPARCSASRSRGELAASRSMATQRDAGRASCGDGLSSQVGRVVEGSGPQQAPACGTPDRPCRCSRSTLFLRPTPVAAVGPTTRWRTFSAAHFRRHRARPRSSAAEAECHSSRARSSAVRAGVASSNAAVMLWSPRCANRCRACASRCSRVFRRSRSSGTELTSPAFCRA